MRIDVNKGRSLCHPARNPFVGKPESVRKSMLTVFATPGGCPLALVGSSVSSRVMCSKIPWEEV